MAPWVFLSAGCIVATGDDSCMSPAFGRGFLFARSAHKKGRAESGAETTPGRRDRRVPRTSGHAIVSVRPPGKATRRAQWRCRAPPGRRASAWFSRHGRRPPAVHRRGRSPRIVPRTTTPMGRRWAAEGGPEGRYRENQGQRAASGNSSSSQRQQPGRRSATEIRISIPNRDRGRPARPRKPLRLIKSGFSKIFRIKFLESPILLSVPNPIHRFARASFG